MTILLNFFVLYLLLKSIFNRKILFVTNDLREEMQESTHENILKDDVT
jgi:hypothetical protein